MNEQDNIQMPSGQHCPYAGACGIIESLKDKLPGLVERFRDNYCYKNHRACARRWVWDFLGPENVPDLMMPQQHDWAEQLLFEAGIRYAAFQARYQMLRRRTGSE